MTLSAERFWATLPLNKNTVRGGNSGMIYHFILNPKSGRSRRLQNVEDAIKAACRSRQLSYHIYYTTMVGDATEYVRAMIRHAPDERQRFICIGGDGTINEIVNSAPSHPNAEFGVIPNGSGNDFVRNFTEPKLFTSIEAQIDGDTVPLDLIRCNDYYCVNMVNIGFDCAVVKESAKFKRFKWISPGFSYILGVISGLFHRFGTRMRLIFDDGETVDSVLTLTAIGNGGYCGGGFRSCPQALLDDGLMDVVVIRKLSRLSFISLVGSYKKGTYVTKRRAQKYILTRQVPHFRMEFDAPQPICIDGEIKGARTIDFSIVKNGFNFVIPKGCTMKSSAGKH